MQEASDRVIFLRHDWLPIVSTNGTFARKRDLSIVSADVMFDISSYGELSCKILKIEAHKI